MQYCLLGSTFRLNVLASTRASVEHPHPGGPTTAIRRGRARLCEGSLGGRRVAFAVVNTVAKDRAHREVAWQSAAGSMASTAATRGMAMLHPEVELVAELSAGGSARA